MISSEVERTLVKSPPELWTELSDPAALARHLGELGEIRITRVDPERAVEWEAEGTTGSVRIKPSGWGTKVTLSVTREIAMPEQPISVEAVAEVVEPMAEVESEREAAHEAEAEPGSEPQAPEPELEPRRGFFARLFGARRRRESVPEPRETAPIPEPRAEPLERAVESERESDTPDAFAAVRQALSPEAFATIDPFAAGPRTGAVPAGRTAEHEAEQAPDLSAELKAAEEIAAEEVIAVLTSVLDRLGAAHHRPFSRA